MSRTLLPVLIVAALVLSAVAAGRIIAEIITPATHAVIVPLKTSDG